VLKELKSYSVMKIKKKVKNGDEEEELDQIK